jgi:Tfp pilus assembly protein PilN
MLRTNLSTRPFYNVRAVRMALGVIAAIVIVVTLFNLIQIVRLTTSQRTLGARAAAAEDEAAKLRAEAAEIRGQINPEELAVVADAAREANSIIDRRAFSWTGLFTKFEATLPPDVRITAVRPRLDDGTFLLSIGVEARRAEDLDAFMEALESNGGFRDVLAVAEQVSDEGTLQAVVEGTYAPPPRDAVPGTAPASAPAGGGRD